MESENKLVGPPDQCLFFSLGWSTTVWQFGSQPPKIRGYYSLNITAVIEKYFQVGASAKKNGNSNVTWTQMQIVGLQLYLMIQYAETDLFVMLIVSCQWSCVLKPGLAEDFCNSGSNINILHCYFVSARAGQNVEIIIYNGKWVLKAHDGISSGLYRALQQDQTQL